MTNISWWFFLSKLVKKAECSCFRNKVKITIFINLINWMVILPWYYCCTVHKLPFDMLQVTFQSIFFQVQKCWEKCHMTLLLSIVCPKQKASSSGLVKNNLLRDGWTQHATVVKVESTASAECFIPHLAQILLCFQWIIFNELTAWLSIHGAQWRKSRPGPLP